MVYDGGFNALAVKDGALVMLLIAGLYVRRACLMCWKALSEFRLGIEQTEKQVLECKKRIG
jgi:hypothetical protein